MKTDAETLPAVAEPCEQPSPPETPFELTPHTQATHSLAHVTGYITNNNLTAADIAGVLRTARQQDGDGEHVLFYQSQLLDALFHRVSTEAFRKNYVDEAQLDLALRFQRQFRSAIESVAFIKHMKNFRK